ncbi:hypothetical protein [Flavobacterium cerinum]|uniref:Lipoprotein n=1 Tax=Flavobacterium cerinum TaxID=2502784 RepID=A0ABY5IP17_9FLAO|nr:hypothetical protein [Flavobacterium cerinum]UUC44581.1 hypothetical protein NOX80_13175 [Flavobacterium cerinum]
MRYILLTVILICISCGKNEKAEVSEKIRPKATSTNHFFKSKEISIGNTFFAGEELIDFTVAEMNDFDAIDSLSYSIYKSNDHDFHIVAIEKFLENEEVEHYQIMDTVIVKDIKDLRFKEQLKSKAKLTIQLFSKNKLLKEWNYTKPRKKELSSKWLGLYELNINKDADNPEHGCTITFEVAQDSILYKINGSKAYEKYELLGEVKNNELYLIYRRYIDGFEKPSIAKYTDFGRIMFDGTNYSLESPGLNNRFNDGEHERYILNKKVTR